MDMITSLLVLSALPQLVAAVPLVHSSRPVLELLSGDARVFSGESVRLKCSIPVDYKLSWTFLWFRGSEQLPQVSEQLHLWGTKVKDSGKYYCQGVRDSLVGNIHTIKSLPMEIHVDGGWSILKVPPPPSFVGKDLNVTCRVRDEPKLHEVVLYKDRVEVMRQKGPDPTFLLHNLTLEDQGWYSCRASWDFNRQTHSVISAEVPVMVKVILSQPVLEIAEDPNLKLINKMKLVCHLQYNAPDPAPPVHFYFYEGDNKLGTGTSENYSLVRRAPGQYSCRVKVPQLDLARWSGPQSFGQDTGPKTMMPPVLRPRDSWPLGPPNPPLRPNTEPTTARPSPHGPSSSSPLIPPTDVNTHPSDLLPNAYPSTPSTISTAAKPGKQTGVPTPAGRYEEPGEESGESTDLPEGSGSMVDDFDDTPEGSGDLPDEFTDMFEESGDLPKDLDDLHAKADDMLTDLHEGSGDVSDDSDDMLEGSGDVSDDSDDMLEGSGDVSDDSDDMLEGSGGILDDLLDTVLDQHVH